MTGARTDRQRGFTLVELMVATTVAIAIALPVFVMFYGTVDGLAGMTERNAINRQARQAMRLMGDGGVNAGGAPGTDGTDNVGGLRSQKTAVANPYETYRLKQTDNGLSVYSDGLAATTIRCTGPGEPLAACIDSTTTIDVQGWIDEGSVSLQSGQRSVDGRTTELEFKVFHPHRLKRNGTPQNGSIERYRSIFTRNRDD